MSFRPWLPERWEALHVRLRWRGHPLRVRVDQERITFDLDAPAGTVEQVLGGEQMIQVVAGELISVPRETPSPVATR